ncbi:hypothetical protein PG997_009619 [Apiospora hydei]|uniref:Fucose-specific lectin n=1 Tax=Apiospora hydei TaxID=1337664 RepID=A0ABR1VUM9_9PEZI
MAAPTIRSWSRAMLPLVLLASQASAGAVAAWYTDRMGATMMMQDDDTGLIRYSLCNSNSTPVLPEDKSITLPLFEPKPKKGSPLAGVGWFDNTQTQASIWFMDENDDIINSNLHCDMNTGYWSHGGSYTVSGGAKSPSPNTTLAAVVLGATTGYRVFYRDTDNHLHWIGYIPGASGWSEYGTLSNDEMKSSAIAAGFTEGNNITVITPKNNENMEVARLNDDKSWHISTFPRPLNSTRATNATKATDFQLNTKNTPNYTLPAWDGQPSTLGLHIDSKSMRSVFYIGTDGELYQVSDAKDSWALLARQDAKTWPKADSPKAPLAVASNYGNNELRLYYVSGGQVVEVNGDGRKWQAARVLPNYNKSLQGDSGLSTGAKAGIGIGVALGALAVGGTFTALWCMRKRQKRADKAEAAALAANQHPGSPGQAPTTAYSQGAYGHPQQQQYQHLQQSDVGGGAWPVQGYGAQQQQQQQNWGAVHNKPVEKVQRPGELDSPPIYEMNNDQQYYEMAESRPRHEMMGEGHYRETR